MRTVWRIGLLTLCCTAAAHGAERAIPGVTASTAVIDFYDLDVPVQMVEQEYDPALLENLVAPTTAAAQVRLPPVLIEASQWRGSLCGIAKSAHAVFRKPSDWEVFWDLAIKPYLPRPIAVPNIDFSKDMVVGVFRGSGGFPGDVIQIRSIKQGQGDHEANLIVTYRNTSQMQPVFVPPFPVQPFHLKKIPAFPGRVLFQETKR